MTRLALVVAIALGAGVASASDVFEYRPERVPVGALYHYVRTNVDGTNPERIALYVPARDRIEAFKYHPGGSRAGWVIAHLDWTTFSARALESWQVPRTGPPAKVAALRASRDGREVRVTLAAHQQPPTRVAIGRVPWHVYSFDLASLNACFRHLRDPESEFTVGIADPSYADDGPPFAYKGEVRVAFEKRETRGGVACRRYRIDGPGLATRGGTLWVSAEAGHLVDAEIAHPNHPDWTSFKLKLERIEYVSPTEWREFRKRAPDLP